MFGFIFWVAVIGLVIIFRKNISGAVMGVITLVGSIFFSIYLLDTFTIINVRDYVDVRFYDETVENPKETITEVKEKATDVGSKAVDKVNEVGSELDEKYGVGREEDDKEGSDTEDKEDEKESDKKVVVDNDGKEISVEGEFITYDIPIAEVAEKYPNMTERDKELVKSLSWLMSITYEGDNYIFSSVKGHYGFYISSKD